MSFGSNPNYGSTTTRVPIDAGDASALKYYYNLTDKISTDIFNINLGASSLERVIKQLGGPTDTDQLRDQIQTTQHKNSEVIQETSSHFKELGGALQKGPMELKFAVERLKKEFQETLARYDAIQKQLSMKLKMTQTVRQIKHTDRPNASVNAWGEDTGVDEDEKRLLGEAQKQEMLREFEIEQGLMQDRRDRIIQIERDMVDVNQITRDLANLVHEQGDTINSIEQNIERTAEQTDQGVEELVKASRYQNAARSKMCWLLILLLIIFVITMVLVFTLK